MSVRAEDKEFIAHFYKYAFVGLTLEWIRGGMKEAPAAIVERVSTVTHAALPTRWKHVGSETEKGPSGSNVT